MLNDIAKNIITKALQIRKERGENPIEVLEKYKNLTDNEKVEIVDKMRFL